MRLCLVPRGLRTTISALADQVDMSNLDGVLEMIQLVVGAGEWESLNLAFSWPCFAVLPPRSLFRWLHRMLMSPEYVPCGLRRPAMDRYRAIAATAWAGRSLCEWACGAESGRGPPASLCAPSPPGW